MKRSSLNFIVDSAALLVMAGLVWTGLLIYYILPPGTRGGGDRLMLWGWTRHQFGTFHLILAVCLLALIGLHIMLHWTWVCCTAGQAFGHPHPLRPWRDIVGLAVLAALAGIIAGLLWYSRGQVTGLPAPAGRGPASHYIHADQPPPPEPDAAALDEHAISGAMTLAQVAQSANIDTQTLIDRLAQEFNIPPDTSPDQQIGRLRRQYNFDMNDLRTLVHDLATSSPEHVTD